MKPGQIECCKCEKPTFSAWCPSCVAKEWDKQDELKARLTALVAKLRAWAAEDEEISGTASRTEIAMRYNHGGKATAYRTAANMLEAALEEMTEKKVT